MKTIALFSSLLILCGFAATAATTVTALDGTQWKIEVDPDDMTENKGEKEYEETLTFADGKVAANEGQKSGFGPAEYDLVRSGDEDWTFRSEQTSRSAGQAVWTGTIHENEMDGKLVITRKDGTVLTYSFEGNKIK